MVTLGKVTSLIGSVSNVVITGVSFQFLKLSDMMTEAAKKPVRTTHNQNARLKACVLDINASPCIEEFSKKFVNTSMFYLLKFTTQLISTMLNDMTFLTSLWHKLLIVCNQTHLQYSIFLVKINWTCFI